MQQTDLTSGFALIPGEDDAFRSRFVDQRLREGYQQSLELVRKAHERAEEATRRAHLLREWARRSHSHFVQHASAKAEDRTTVLDLALRESERAERDKVRFIAVVSHELRQPLNALSAALQVLEASESEDMRRRAEAVMGRQVRQMTRLMDGLLDMSKLTMGSMVLEPVVLDLCDVLEAALETIAESAREASLRVVRTPGPRSVLVRGDASRLQQVFVNLLSNAVRYTPAGGEIRAELRPEPGWGVVTIADTGVGIAAHEIDHIFEAFTRVGARTAEGFGIGLALVKGLVELHGGNVGVSSPGRNQGSTFVIRLPMA